MGGEDPERVTAIEDMICFLVHPTRGEEYTKTLGGVGVKVVQVKGTVQ